MGQGQDSFQPCEHSSEIPMELREMRVSLYVATGTCQQSFIQPLKELSNSWPEIFLTATRTFQSMISNHFFWLLSLVCFRHVDHGGTMDKAMKIVLDSPDAYIASSGKDKW